MRGAIPPLSQYVFIAWCLVKHRDNVALPLPVKQCKEHYVKWSERNTTKILKGNKTAKY
jgi:hypothetical protein